MTMDFSTLRDEPRLLMEAELRPMQGDRFQSTGFADLGPARYQAFEKKGDREKDPGRLVEMLLVESAQSVANRLETVCWDEGQGRLVPDLEGMSLIIVQRPDGAHLTNSLLEAHRINSPYILEGKDTKVFDMLRRDVAGMEAGPVDIRLLARTVFKYDANAVLHGVFLAKSNLAGGRLRLPRLLSGFVEARDVRVAESGGVKNDRVNPSKTDAPGDASQGFGNVPFHRTEFTAARITAFFNLDLAQLRGYGLGEEAGNFLVALALFKVRRFLSRGLRLRTACDLEPTDGLEATRPHGYTIPGEAELSEAVRTGIAACRRAGLFPDPPATVVTWEVKPKPKSKKGAGAASADDQSSEVGDQ
jgi:CRISPR-associated protein Csb1